MSSDVLQEIADDDLPKLRDLYKEHTDYAPHVYSLLNTYIKWKHLVPNENYLTFYAFNGDWQTNGTFVLLMQYGCYNVFVFTLEKSCETLYKSLTETNFINWKKSFIFYTLICTHVPIVLKALTDMKIPIGHFGVTCLWCIGKEKALKFTTDCPDDVYIAKLNIFHAPLIYDLWPHKIEGSEEYIATLIKMNGGYGIFLKSDGSLVSWIIKNHLGQLGILQTVDDHKCKGYGKLVTKVLSKEIAEEGLDPLGIVVKGNVGPEVLFSNLGFVVLNICTYIELY